MLADYRAAAAFSDALIEATPLTAPPKSPEDWWPAAGLSFSDLRSVIVHVLVETATHAGQLDAARELIDGRPYLVLE